MAVTMIDVSGAIVSATISGALSRAEVKQIQVAALEAIRRCGKISALFVLENFRDGSERLHGAISAF